MASFDDLNNLVEPTTPELETPIEPTSTFASDQFAVPLEPSVPEVKQATIADISSQKAASVANASAEKQAKLRSPKADQRLNNILQKQMENDELDRMATFDGDRSAYIATDHPLTSPAQRAQIFDQKLGQDEAFRQSQLGHTEGLSDFGKSILKGGLQLATVIPALGSLFTGGAIGQDSMAALNDLTNQLSDSQSDALNAQKQRLFAAVDKEYIANTFKAMQEGTEDDAGQIASSFLKETGVTIREAFNNPLVILDLVGEEGVSFIAGGWVGKKVATSMAKKTAKELSEEAGTTAGLKAIKEASEKGGERAALALTGLEEGAGVSAEATNEVLGMNHEDLMETSVLYPRLLAKNNGDQEAAKSELAASVGSEAMLKGALAAVGISKLTGAAKLEGNVFNKYASLATVKAGATEAVEEAVQGTLTQGLANQVVQQKADITKDVREGLGAEAGLGGVAGGTIGSGITGASKLAQVPSKIKAKILSNGETEATEETEVPETVAEPIVAPSTPTVEEVTNTKDTVNNLNVALSEHTTENESVQEILDGISSLDGNLAELIGTDPENADIDALITSGAIATATVSQIKETVEAELAKTDLNDKDRAVLESVKAEIDKGNLDSVSGSIAAAAEANPKLKENLDTAFKRVIASTPEEQDAILDELITTLDSDPEQAVIQRQALIDGLLKTKLYSKDILDDDSITPEQLDKAASMTSGDIATQYTALATFKKTYNEVANEVANGKDKSDFKGVLTSLDNIKVAVANSDSQTINEEISGLNSFYRQRAYKARAIQQELARIPQSERDEDVEVVYGNPNQTTLTAGTRDRGSFTVYGNQHEIDGEPAPEFGERAANKMVQVIAGEQNQVAFAIKAANDLLGLETPEHLTKQASRASFDTGPETTTSPVNDQDPRPEPPPIEEGDTPPVDDEEDQGTPPPPPPIVPEATGNQGTGETAPKETKYEFEGTQAELIAEFVRLAKEAGITRINDRGQISLQDETKPMGHVRRRIEDSSQADLQEALIKLKYEATPEKANDLIYKTKLLEVYDETVRTYKGGVRKTKAPAAIQNQVDAVGGKNYLEEKDLIRFIEAMGGTVPVKPTVDTTTDPVAEAQAEADALHATVDEIQAEAEPEVTTNRVLKENSPKTNTAKVITATTDDGELEYRFIKRKDGRWEYEEFLDGKSSRKEMISEESVEPFMNKARESIDGELGTITRDGDAQTTEWYGDEVTTSNSDQGKPTPEAGTETPVARHPLIVVALEYGGLDLEAFESEGFERKDVTANDGKINKQAGGRNPILKTGGKLTPDGLAEIGNELGIYFENGNAALDYVNAEITKALNNNNGILLSPEEQYEQDAEAQREQAEYEADIENATLEEAVQDPEPTPTERVVMDEFVEETAEQPEAESKERYVERVVVPLTQTEEEEILANARQEALVASEFAKVQLQKTKDKIQKLDYELEQATDKLDHDIEALYELHDQAQEQEMGLLKEAKAAGKTNEVRRIQRRIDEGHTKRDIAITKLNARYMAYTARINSQLEQRHREILQFEADIAEAENVTADESNQYYTRARTEYSLNNDIDWADITENEFDNDPRGVQALKFVNTLIQGFTGKRTLNAIASFLNVNPEDIYTTEGDTVKVHVRGLKTLLNGLDSQQVFDLQKLIQERKLTKADKAHYDSRVEANDATIKGVAPDSLIRTLSSLQDNAPAGELDFNVIDWVKQIPNRFKRAVVKFRKSMLWDDFNYLNGLRSLANQPVELIKDLVETLNIDVSSYNESDTKALQQLNNKHHWFNQQMATIAAKVKLVTAKEFAYENRINYLRDLLDVNGNFPPKIIDAAFLAYLDVTSILGESFYVDDTQLVSALGLANKSELAGVTGVAEMRIVGTPIDNKRFGDAFSKALGIRLDASTAENVKDGITSAMGATLKEILSMDPEVHTRIARRETGEDVVGYTVKTKENIESHQKWVKEHNWLTVSQHQWNGVTSSLTNPETGGYIFHNRTGNSLVNQLAPTSETRKSNWVNEKPPMVTTNDRHIRSNDTLTEDEVEAENIYRQTAWEPVAIVNSFMEAIGLKGFEFMNGKTPDGDLALMNREHRLTAEGINLRLVDQFDKMTNLKNKIAELGGEAKIYFESAFAITRRQQMRGDVNPQGDKYHRIAVGLVNSPTFEDIDLNNIDFNNATAKQKYFILALGQALGIDADKQGNEATFKEALEMVRENQTFPDTEEGRKEEEKAELRSAAVSLLAGWMHNGAIHPDASFSQEELELLKEAMGGNFHKQQGMLILAQMQSATNNGVVTGFKHHLRYEIDGLTNGPFHSTWYTGLGDMTDEEIEETLLKGGLIKTLDTKGIHDDMKKPNSRFKDFYNTAAEAGYRVFNTIVGALHFDMAEASSDGLDWKVAGKQRVLDGIDYFSTKKISIAGNRVNFQDGDDAIIFVRNLFKNPVTVTVYGGGETGINNNIANGFKETFYEELSGYITQLTNSKSGATTALIMEDLKYNLRQYNDAIFNYSNTEMDYKLNQEFSKLSILQKLERNPNMSEVEIVKLLTDYKMTTEEVAGLSSFVKDTFGSAVNGGIDEVFGANKHTAALMNASINYITALANDLFGQAYTKRLDELVQEGTLATGDTLPANEVRAIQLELQKALPFVKTALQADAFDVSKDDGTYAGNQNALKFHTGETAEKSTNYGNNTKVDHTTKAMGSPGVRAIPLLTISIDAQTQIMNHILQGKHGKFLNVLDAIDGTADGSLRAASEVFNVAEYMSMMTTDPIQNMIDAFESAMQVQLQPITLAGHEIIPTFKSLFDANIQGDKNARLSPEQEIYRSLMADMTLPIHKNLPSFFENGDVNTAINYMWQQLKIEQQKNQNARGDYIFRGDTTITQMGGIDDGGAKVIDGEVTLSDEAEALLDPESLKRIELFNMKVRVARDKWAKTQHLQQPQNLSQEELRLMASMDRESKKELHAEFGHLHGGMWQGLRGTANLDRDTITYTFESAADSDAFIDKLFGDRVRVDPETNRSTTYNEASGERAGILNTAITINNAGGKAKLRGVLAKTEITIAKELEGNANGSMEVITDGNGRPVKFKITLKEGLTTSQASTVLSHELNHAITQYGAAKGSVDHITGVDSEESLMVKALLGQIKRYLGMNMDGNASQARIKILHDAYLADSNNPNKLLVLIQEYMAHVSTEHAEHAAFTGGVIDKANLLPPEHKHLIPKFTSIIQKSLKAIAKHLRTYIKFIGNPWSAKAINSRVSYTEGEILSQAINTFMMSKTTQLKPETQELIENVGPLQSNTDSVTDLAITMEADATLKAKLQNLAETFLNGLPTVMPTDTSEIMTKTPQQIDYINTLSAAGIPLSDVEQYALSVMSLTFNSGAKHKWYNRNKVNELFNHARKTIKYTDLLPEGMTDADPAYPQAVLLAKRQYKGIFQTKNDGYLGNFMALTHVSPWFKNVLVNTAPPTTTDDTDKSMLESVTSAVNKVIKKLGDKVTKVDPESNTYQQLRELSKNLNRTTNRRKTDTENKFRDIEDGLNDLLKRGGSGAISAVLKALGTTNVTAAELAQIAPEDRILHLKEGIEQMLAFGGNKPMAALTEAIAEFLPRDRRESQRIDRHRDKKAYTADSTRENTQQVVHTELDEAFTQLLTDEESAAVTMSLRADLNALTSRNFTYEQINDMLRDPVLLDAEIRKQVQAFNNVKGLANSQRILMMNEAAAMGTRSIVGGAFEGFNLPNARAISRLYGTGIEVKNLDAANQAEPLIDQLGSLLAIKAMSNTDKSNLGTVLTRELARTDGKNGLSTFTKKHVAVTQRLTARYKGAENSLPKGFIPTKNDTTKSVRIVRKADMHKYHGYTFVRNVARDPQDVIQSPLVMIQSSEGGSVPYVQGAMDTIELSLGEFVYGNGKPTDKNSPYYAASGAQRAITKKKRNELTSKYSSALIKPVPLQDGMIPNLNATGKVIGYKYALSNVEKNAQLNTETNAAKILSSYDARIHEEGVGLGMNTVLAKELYDTYQGAMDKENYVKVHARSSDPVLAEIWRVTPHHMRQELAKYFGGNMVYVHKRDLSNALGYREWSISELWNAHMQPDGSKRQEFALMLNALLSDDAMARLRWAERAVQEGVAALKDLIVIKSTVVPAANLVSNVNQLSLRGVSMEDITKYSIEAINAGKAYKKANLELIRVNHLLETETDPKILSELTSLQNELIESIETNPVTPLVREGFMPSVVEDLSTGASEGSIKEGLIDKLTPKVIKEGGDFIDVGKEVIITQDSETYKAMSSLMEMGDFAAKYTLYKHLTVNEGVAHEDALLKARTEFINYGTLSSRSMDYLNKTGGTFFFKFFMRAQPIMVNAIRTNPTRAFTTLIGADTIGLPNIFEAMLPAKDISAATGTYDLLGMGLGAHPYF